ncbi:MAG: hypothetical protein KGI54_01675 [Pseudomonadota bacterium]|nr:hypothetical protein [Pseudomonadota bacterium]
MHVTFVSLCEKRAIGRTRAILDRYAIRIGETTWTTPITEDALNEIHKALKRCATRQTAVACYQNSGMRRMSLRWVVGAKERFGKHGEIAVVTSDKVNRIEDYPQWKRDVQFVAKQSGLLHDIGKASSYFAKKIEPENAREPITDPIRHELISTIVFLEMIKGKSWEEAWNGGYLNSTDRLTGKNVGRKQQRGKIISDGICNVIDAIAFCVATHHRLFNNGNAENHVMEGSHQIQKSNRPDHELYEITKKTIHRLKEREAHESIDYWTGVSIIARAALILADHKISSNTSTPYGKDPDKNTLFANTTRDNKGRPIYNQKLSSHLSMVSHEASSIAQAMIGTIYRSIAESGRESIKRISSGIYEWQNRAANSLNPEKPTLVMNIAATGAGKTRMNARAAAVLAGDKPLRLTTLLGLRSLTLQTGDAYIDELGINTNDISVVIGCPETRKLHEYERDDATDDISINDNIPYSTNVGEYEADVIFSSEHEEIPEWIRSLPYAHAKDIVLPPLLVSTVDYMIAAGNPSKQGNHALALARLMNSDLILDEIDSYDPKALSSVLRLVKLSAMFGRNVIVSSGTLPETIAKYIWESYRSGHVIHAAISKKANMMDCIIINDSVDPVNIKTDNPSDDFGKQYIQYLDQLQECIRKKPITKKARIVDVGNGIEGIVNTIKSSIGTLHAAHCWSKKNVSFGLVRIANIKHAIKVAKELSNEPNTFVCCYHARHFMIQRYYIETRLDRLLKRKKDNWQDDVLSDSEIQDCIQNSNGNTRIVIVATPVEEIGRDHDFDWAIIEPSSAHSIVQTAGRVNRHRRKEITEVNIHILNFNFKYAEGGEKAIFEKPGYESFDKNKSSHGEDRSMHSLINEAIIREQLDSSLCFDKHNHPFARFDSQSIKNMLENWASPFIKNETKWMDADYYTDTALREKTPMREYYFDGENWHRKELVFKDGKLKKDEPIDNNWVIDAKGLKGLFTKPIEELKIISDECDIKICKSLSVSVYSYGDDVSIIHEMSRFGCAK